MLLVLWACTYRHVGLAACIQRFGHRVHQVAADAEVAHFHLAQSVDQNVGGLHVCAQNSKAAMRVVARRLKKLRTASALTSDYLCVSPTAYCVDALMPLQSVEWTENRKRDFGFNVLVHDITALPRELHFHINNTTG